MYAVIDHKGKQYKVRTGEEVLVDLMRATEGELVQFDRVLAIGGAGATNAGVYAAQIIATSDARLAAKLERFKQAQARKIAPEPGDCYLLEVVLR